MHIWLPLAVEAVLVLGRLVIHVGVDLALNQCLANAVVKGTETDAALKHWDVPFVISAQRYFGYESVFRIHAVAVGAHHVKN